MKNQPNVNIIIVTFNEYHFTEACVNSLLNGNYEKIKIFLVDNGSKKEYYAKFYDMYKSNKKIEFIRLEQNNGFGEGCNQAIRRIKKGYIVFLNNDTVVDKDFLNPIIDYMEKNPKVGACQPKIKDINRKAYFEHAGGAGGFMDAYGFPFTRGRIFYTVEKDTGQYDNVVSLVWCSGTAMVTKKDVLNKVGNFDDIFFMYGEEADLCWRIYHAGFDQAFIPQSVVYHHGSGTMRHYPNYRKTFLSHRNGIILLLKNYSIKELIQYLPVRLFFDFIAFFYYLFTSYPYNALAVIAAYFNVLLLLPKIFIRRLETDRIKILILTKKRNNYPLFSKSIVIEYFLFRKKTFSSLSHKDFI